MNRLLYRSTTLLVTIIAMAWGSVAQAVSWTSSLTGDNHWNTIYGQGFSAGTNDSNDPGVTYNSTSPPTVYLNNFEFFESGLTTVSDQAGSAALPNNPIPNVQLAILSANVNGWYPNLASLTTSSFGVVAVSTNTLQIPIGTAYANTPLNFTFNSAPISFGAATDADQRVQYGAFFVNVGAGGSLTPVLVPAISVFYDPNNNNTPTQNYGAGTGDYLNAASAYIHTDTYGSFFDTFSDSGDADFVATFSSTLPLHGDINNDGHFDAADIMALEKALANPSSSALSQSDLLSRGDFNGDGKLTNADLQGMLVALESGQGSLSSTPEPSAFVLSALAGVALLLQGRRRRNLRHGVTQGA